MGRSQCLYRLFSFRVKLWVVTNFDSERCHVVERVLKVLQIGKDANGQSE